MLKKKSNLCLFIIFSSLILLFYNQTGGLCIFKFLLGIPCPGCGATRAIILLLKGDIHGCLEMNPAAPLFLLIILKEIYSNYFSKRPKKTSNALLIGSVIFALTVYIIRMKLYFPWKEPYTFNENNLLIQLLRTIKTINLAFIVL